MNQFVWTKGRLSWPPVIVAAYFSASLIVADYLWRIAVMPFDSLLLYVTFADLAVGLALFGLYLFFRRPMPRR